MIFDNICWWAHCYITLVLQICQTHNPIWKSSSKKISRHVQQRWTHCWSGENHVIWKWSFEERIPIFPGLNSLHEIYPHLNCFDLVKKVLITIDMIFASKSNQFSVMWLSKYPIIYPLVDSFKISLSQTMVPRRWKITACTVELSPWSWSAKSLFECSSSVWATLIIIRPLDDYLMWYSARAEPPAWIQFSPSYFRISYSHS